MLKKLVVTKRIKKIFFRTFILGSVSVILLILFCNFRIEKAGKGKLYSDVSAIPHQHVGLLLGTGKYMSDGSVNLFYKYRIEAALSLLKSNKIDYLVISGDNSRPDYNEPAMMRDDLVAAGIDISRIYLDYAGFRTFDSVVRLREIFGTDSATIISQEFHNERALYIAGKENITAIGFNAQDVGGSGGFKTQLREYLARVKVFVDYIIHTKPHFLGPKVQIPQ
ncbi:MAG TPA: ElyC/SanA/YdcF family protein [Chitinophagales bacterium]|nr:YdcF family protein [Chitinophagales bacterium]HMU69781.1 ElyC/SanA/YdcF family protein [Chitinophagales bacterium]HMX03918.1 ElyC/SanA/YdcF family protein [Chitinophagales bacterium]HMZ87897.1 ElyC/SanA/YdcF family protein [Chitinophagales bacterium]HNA58546.1 ElyC/SanA/YdcF family protein [Chitinophagales bacterium]